MCYVLFVSHMGLIPDSRPESQKSPPRAEKRTNSRPKHRPTNISRGKSPQFPPRKGNTSTMQENFAENTSYLHKVEPPGKVCAEMRSKMHKKKTAYEKTRQTCHKTKNPAFQLGFCAGEGTRTPTPLCTRS